MFSCCKLSLFSGALGISVAIPFASPFYYGVSVNNNDILSTLNSAKLDEKVLAETIGIDSSSEYSENFGEPTKNKLEKCKLIVSKKDIGKLEMCLKEGDETKVEFNFYEETVVNSIPIKVKELKVTYIDLVLELAEQEKYNNTKIFDLPYSFFGTSSDITFSKHNASSSNMKFSEKDCIVSDIFKESDERVNWRAKCTIRN